MAPEAEKSPFDPNPVLVTKSDRLHFYVNVEFCGSVSGKTPGVIIGIFYHIMVLFERI